MASQPTRPYIPLHKYGFIKGLSTIGSIKKALLNP